MTVKARERGCAFATNAEQTEDEHPVVARGEVCVGACAHPTVDIATANRVIARKILGVVVLPVLAFRPAPVAGGAWRSWLLFFIFGLPFADLIVADVLPDPRRPV